jgi:hypothetical protein
MNSITTPLRRTVLGRTGLEISELVLGGGFTGGILVGWVKAPDGPSGKCRA